MMDFSADHAAFTGAVIAVGRAVPVNPIQPEHGGILLDAADGTVAVRAYDLETAITRRIDADVVTSGRVLVSGRLLAQVGKVLPRKPVHAKVRDAQLAIQAGNSVFGLPLIPEGAYPALPEPSGVASTVDGEQFAVAVDRACSALTGADAAVLKSLFGVRLEAEGNRLTVLATDRFRMAVEEIAWDGPEMAVLLPAEALNAAAKAIEPGPATLHVGRSFGLTSGATTSTMRVLDQGYPPWSKVLAAPHVAMVVVDPAELSAALRRVEVVSGKFPHVLLSVGNSEIQISAARTTDVRGEAAEIVECEVTGDPISTKINGEYLRSMIAALRSEHLSLGFSSPPNRHPVLGFPLEVRDLEKPETPRVFAVMPVR
jgi:DNA polymerase-3 subunit beta